MDARIASAALAYAQSLTSGQAAPATNGAAASGGGFAQVLEKALADGALPEARKVHVRRRR